MATQIAVRIPDSALAAMDDAIRAGRFESRAAAVREGLQRLLHEEREREIAEDYRRAYTDRPEEEAVGEAGLTLMAESIAELEKGSRNHP
ncbi:MAG: ribbon-helix-helix domain-containing protein [Thermoleophilaceae bacterium]